MNHINDTSACDLESWNRTRDDILSAAMDVMGPLPSHDRTFPPEWSILDETACDGYLRRRITYVSEPGCDTTAFLCIPSDATPNAPTPGVLCLHPTNHTHGYEDVVGLSERPNRNYAAELTQRGFATISPSYPLMADYQPDIDTLGYASGTMKAIWDNIRALDLLASLDEVDASGFGAIGHSLGGHNAIYTAVFDDRIRAAVSNCGLDSFEDYYNWTPGKGWTQHRYMPRIGAYASPSDIPFDFHDLVASLAPRACLVSAPLHDDNFKWKSAASVVEAARKVYRLHNSDSAVQIIHPDCPHDFPPDIRHHCYDFLAKHLPPTPTA